MLEYEAIYTYDDREVSATEYMALYNALIGDLTDDIKKKQHLIKRYTEEIADINQRIESIQKAKERTFKEVV